VDEKSSLYLKKKKKRKKKKKEKPSFLNGQIYIF